MLALWVKIARLLRYAQIFKTNMMISITNKQYNYGKLDLERLTLHFLLVMSLAMVYNMYSDCFVQYFVTYVTVLDYLETL